MDKNIKYTEITNCRICGNDNLVQILDLGTQALSGVFPEDNKQKLTTGNLQLVKCHNTTDCCGLVQLKQTYDLSEMYGDNYGYRSGLNSSMCEHLKYIAKISQRYANLKINDTIIDIGSNNGTLLNEFNNNIYELIGIDPVAGKFLKYYNDNIFIIPAFFPNDNILDLIEKAKLIFSIAMFYDLTDPFGFMQNVYNSLEDDGIWIFEQHYLPDILKTTGYDAICQEHLSFYAFKQIYWMTQKVGFKIIDIENNKLNGGSLLVIATKENNSHRGCTNLINEYLLKEKDEKINDIDTYIKFENNVKAHKEELKLLINELNSKGKKIFGYCASTKGNIILQYCGFTKKDIPYFVEINEDKYGKLTPGSNIPIISEKEAKKMKPDYLLVMAWHFKDYILEKEKEWIKQGIKFIFPLPKIEII